MRTTHAEIDLGALRRNIAVIRGVVRPQTRLFAVVKADAYGHGSVDISRAALEAGADTLCVAIADEGIRLRSAGITAPILVLGGADGEGARLSVRHGLIQTVFSEDILLEAQDEAARLGIGAQVAFKIDTGMNRIGMRTPGEVARLLDCLDNCPSLSLHSVFTHFAVADEASDFTRVQLDRFLSLSSAIRARRPEALLHAANSAALFRFPESQLDAVRMGLAMYGYSPAPDIPHPLLPVMSWKTRIVLIKDIAAGDTVSYGRTFTADGPITVATLPVGYGDGYFRCLGNRAFVLIGGRRARVLGRVCMDQMMVDVSGLGAQVGDEAVLIGSQGSQRVGADDLASWADTIPYEITLSVSARVPRVVLG